MLFRKGSLLHKLEKEKSDGISESTETSPIEMQNLKQAHEYCIKAMNDGITLPPPIYENSISDAPPDYTDAENETFPSEVEE